MLLSNQQKRKNGLRNIFMTKSYRKNMPEVGINLWTMCLCDFGLRNRRKDKVHI